MTDKTYKLLWNDTISAYELIDTTLTPFTTFHESIEEAIRYASKNSPNIITFYPLNSFGHISAKIDYDAFAFEWHMSMEDGTVFFDDTLWGILTLAYNIKSVISHGIAIYL